MARLAFRFLLVGFLATALAGDQSLGQDGAQQPGIVPQDSHTTSETKAQFKSQAILIQVPVVVTDKSGNHIHNLSQQDFTIFQNDKEQKIAVFEEVNSTSARRLPTPSSPGVFGNLSLQNEQPSSITIILLDMVNTPFLNQTYGRAQLVKFLKQNLHSGPVLALMVISGKGLKVISSVTDDSTILIGALKTVTGEISVMQGFSTEAQARAASGEAFSVLGNGLESDAEARLREFVLRTEAVESFYWQQRAIEETLRAFLSIAWSLAGVPGRKSVVWATGGFPFYLGSPSTVALDAGLAPLYERTMEALNDAQISVYPVDVGGLMSASGLGHPPLSFLGDPRRQQLQSSLQDYTIDSFRNFAEMTGGRPFYNDNDLARGFQRAIEDSSSYYSTGYYLDTHRTRRGWQRLHVNVQRKDVEVRARNGFVVGNFLLNPESLHKADINFALDSPVDSTGVPVRVRWTAPAPGESSQRKAEFVITVPATGVFNESNGNRFDMDFIWETDKGGSRANRHGQTIKGALTTEGLLKVKSEGLSYKNVLELPPGDYAVRFVIRNNLSGRIGSVTAPLTVN